MIAFVKSLTILSRLPDLNRLWCTNMEVKQFSAKMRAITETVEEIERHVQVANEDTGLLSID